MRRHGLAVLLLLVAIALALGVSGCTGSPEESESPEPTAAAEPTGSSSAMTPAEAQAALDDALAAVDKEGSIGFTSRGQNVIDDEVTKISGSGAWTRSPLAWTTTTTYDRPKGFTFDSRGDQTTELIYMKSTPEGPYARNTYSDLPPRQQQAMLAWIVMPGYGVREGVTEKDVSTPPDLRMLVQTKATAGSALGDTLTISGTIPSSSALDILDLTSHLGGLGFANRFADSTTRVLVTIGADGLPQTLEFAGTNISLPGVGLPDYVAQELAGARYFVEYGDAKLDGPIKAPGKALTLTP